MEKQQSFTIVELLVVVATILLFSGASIGYYTHFTETNKLQNASKRISTMLSLVRQKTVSGDSTMCAPVPNTTPPAEVSFYSFEVVTATTYTVRPFCSIGTPKPLTYTNESNIQFITPAPPTPPLPVVTFYPVTGNSTCNYIYLRNKTLASAEECRYVKISAVGSISEGACATCATCPKTCP